MKKVVLGLLALVLIGLGIVFTQQERIITRLLESQAVPRMSGQMFNELPDGLHVMLCGAGSPMPDPNRSGPCTVVVAGKQAFVFDVGSGSAGNIGLMGVPPSALQAVLLTHFHSDHIDGLGELLLQRWAGSGAEQPLPVYGPPGVEKIVAGFNLAYEIDAGYRTAHHGADTIPPSGRGGLARPFPQPPGNEAVTVLDEGELKITAFNVVHEPIHPALGYRIEYKDRSVVISGDTAPSENLQHHAQGVDLLVHEAQSSKLVEMMRQAALKAGNQQMATIFHDILGYHTDPVDAAKIAEAVGAKHLLFYHVVPGLPVKPLERLFMQGVSEAFSGEATLGEDGTAIFMLAGGHKIEVENRLP